MADNETPTLLKVIDVLRILQGDVPTTTVNQAAALLVVMAAPGQTIPMGELGERLGMIRPHLSRVIATLTERGGPIRAGLRGTGRGLIELYADSTDSRYKHVRLTARGRDMAARIERTLES